MSPSPPFVTIAEVTAVLQLVILGIVLFTVVTQRAINRKQRELNEQLAEHRREHVAGASAGPPNLSFRCSACGLTGYGSTNAPAHLELGMPCPICGVQVELVRTAPDVS